jgi:hypothetical protein
MTDHDGVAHAVVSEMLHDLVGVFAPFARTRTRHAGATCKSYRYILHVIMARIEKSPPQDRRPRPSRRLPLAPPPYSQQVGM